MESRDKKIEMLSRIEETKHNIVRLAKKGNEDEIEREIESLLSLKGQIDIEPMRFHIPEADVIHEHAEDTFYIAETASSAIFHTYGGYTLIADSRNANSLYMTLRELAEYMEDQKEYIDKRFGDILEAERKIRDSEMTDFDIAEFRKSVEQSVGTDYIVKEFMLKLPWWCFCDISATYNIAETAYKTFSTLLENSSKELTKEDVDSNELFREIVMSADSTRKEKG